MRSDARACTFDFGVGRPPGGRTWKSILLPFRISEVQWVRDALSRATTDFSMSGVRTLNFDFRNGESGESVFPSYRFHIKGHGL